MIGKKDDSIQKIQSILGRTHTGRIISDSAKSSVLSCGKNINSKYGKTECKVCGLILTSNYFIRGCVNCGSKDVNNLGVNK